jgi:hypothetical protein
MKDVANSSNSANMFTSTCDVFLDKFGITKWITFSNMPMGLRQIVPGWIFYSETKFVLLSVYSVRVLRVSPQYFANLYAIDIKYFRMFIYTFMFIVLYSVGPSIFIRATVTAGDTL